MRELQRRTLILGDVIRDLANPDKPPRQAHSGFGAFYEDSQQTDFRTMQRVVTPHVAARRMASMKRGFNPTHHPTYCIVNPLHWTARETNWVDATSICQPQEQILPIIYRRSQTTPVPNAPRPYMVEEQAAQPRINPEWVLSSHDSSGRPRSIEERRLEWNTYFPDQPFPLDQA